MWHLTEKCINFASAKTKHKKGMRKLTYIFAVLVLAGLALQACHDDETYAEQKEKERDAIGYFLSRSPLILVNQQGDTLLNIDKINVISEEQFEAQDSMTDVSKNEFVLFRNTGIYLQIVRKGVGEKIKAGETKRVISRYWEWNILGDSLQTTDMVPYFATNPEIMDVSNNSGTISASFNTDINGGGAMYMTYKGNASVMAVPAGWILPMVYVNLGRQISEDEGIAKVRIIVPHGSGHSDATTNVYPCFYEITYQEMRN